MATTRTTFGSILTTASTAANAVTAAINVVDQGTSMLTQNIAKHKINQSQQIKNDLAVMLYTKQDETVLRLAEHQLTVDAFTSKSAKHAEYYSKFNDIYESLIAKVDQELA